ncbi:MAG: hypothetical protein LUD72_02635 [Bacteroidales bacterium]|nr:hypothetical protein [Bacteroidales bacterium]
MDAGNKWQQVKSAVTENVIKVLKQRGLRLNLTESVGRDGNKYLSHPLFEAIDRIVEGVKRSLNERIDLGKGMEVVEGEFPDGATIKMNRMISDCDARQLETLIATAISDELMSYDPRNYSTPILSFDIGMKLLYEDCGEPVNVKMRFTASFDRETVDDDYERLSIEDVVINDIDIWAGDFDFYFDDENGPIESLENLKMACDFDRVAENFAGAVVE